MNTAKSIILATLIAAGSSLAQASGVDQYGRGTPNVGTGVNVQSVGGNVHVQTVQGRSSILNSVPSKNNDTVYARAASDVLGRS